MQEIFLQTWIKELHKNLHFMETYRVFLVFSVYLRSAISSIYIATATFFLSNIYNIKNTEIFTL